MIKDLSNGRLDEIKAFASKHNLTESFNNTFRSFENYNERGYDVTVVGDFTPIKIFLS